MTELFKYLKKYIIFGIIAPLFMLGEATMDLLQPKMMSVIIDEGVLGVSNGGVGNMDIILNMGIKMIIVVILGGIAGVLSGVFANLFGQNFSNDLRKDCFKKIMSFSFEQTDKFSTGSLVTRVTNDVTQVQNLALMSVRGFVRTGLLFVGGIFFLVSLNLSFGAVIACTVPVVLASMIYFIMKANPKFLILQSKLDKVNSVVQENVSGARVVKAYVKEEYEQERFSEANNQLFDTQLGVLKLFAFMSPIANIVLNISSVAIIKVGAIKAANMEVTPGQIMAAITYISQIMHGVIMVAMIFQSVSRGAASAKRINEVLACDPAIEDGTGNTENKRGGKIEFKNVSFSYPESGNEKVLDDVSITINSGETFAILGATGSGKTSFANLIPRFYDVNEGSVLVDDTDVRDYPLHELRSRIAFALQTSELFTCSIKENILWGRESASQEEVEQAAKYAQAHDFIVQKEDGYDTAVAERGMSLSGGQRQRVAISRALLKNAEVLILDDSTSALDLRTEAKIYKALNSEYKNMTKIIIAQRIASVMNADRIAIIENGKIAACDNHTNLLKNCDIYKDIYNSQLKKC